VKYYTNKARQAGMTLIELTVVLLVLIGLAGLMIPYVGGFVSKTHDSTGSDSLASLNSAIQRYDVQFLGQPAGYDSLMSNITSGSGAVYTKLMNGDGTGTLDAKDYVKVVSLDAESFTDVGIDNVMLMDSTTSDATFAATASSVNLSGTVELLALQVSGTCGMNDPMGCIEDDAELGEILGRKVDTDANDYVIFGVGQDSAMVGKTVSEAPVHFAKTGAMSAANKYNRILAVYAVPKIGCLVTATSTAISTYYAAGATTTTPITMEAHCTAADTAYDVPETTAGDQVNAGAIGTTWAGAMAQKAQFVTTAMPMMKLEGLGGALASHYSSVDK